MSYNLLDWDTSIKVGDYVFRKHAGYDKIYKVLSINKQFVTADDIRYATYPGHRFYGAILGEEYSPSVHIQLAANLQYTPVKPKRTRRTGHRLPGNYLIKVTPTTFAEHIARLNELVAELFP